MDMKKNKVFHGTVDGDGLLFALPFSREMYLIKEQILFLS